MPLSDFYQNTAVTYSFTVSAGVNITADTVTLKVLNAAGTAIITKTADVITNGTTGGAVLSLSVTDTTVQPGNYPYSILWADASPAGTYLVEEGRVNCLRVPGVASTTSFPYCSLSEVKQALGITSTDTDDDYFLSDLIWTVKDEIDLYCGRSFVGVSETRYYNALTDVAEYGKRLMLDRDLQTITTLTNGDGEVLAAADYVLFPTNRPPYNAVVLLSSGSKTFTYNDDPENAISLAGVWGFTANQEPPAPIRRAAIRLVVLRYKQRDLPFDTAGVLAGGQAPGFVPLPSTGLPVDIQATLDRYKRHYIIGV